MAICKKIVRTSKRVCAGSLNRRILVDIRSITPPIGGSISFGEDFALQKEVWSMISTVKGVVIFDSTNTARDISHNIYIRYDKELEMTAEKWVTLLAIDGSVNVKLDIVRVENLEEENRFHLLSCALRGDESIPANSA